MKNVICYGMVFGLLNLHKYEMCVMPHATKTTTIYLGFVKVDGMRCLVDKRRNVADIKGKLLEFPLVKRRLGIFMGIINFNIV